MATQYCMGCGSPLGPGEATCAYCGRANPAASPARPLPTRSATLPSGSAPLPGSPAPAPPPARSSRFWRVVVVVVVVVVLVATIGILLTGPGPAIEIAGIDVYAPDDVCGLNAHPISYRGFNASSGASEALDLELPNYNATSCTVHNVTTNSSGFRVIEVQPADTVAGGAAGQLNLTLVLPGGRFTGVVNLVFA